MKRTPIKRKTAIRPSKPLAHGPARLRRSKIKPVNRKRKAEKLARNFGAEAQRVRDMGCLVESTLMVIADFGDRYKLACEQDARGVTTCSGDIEAAHVGKARGMGGVNSDRYRLAPLCTRHHEEASEPGTSKRAAFEERTGIDLDKEADRIAVEHPDGLGIRGLARRHTEPRCGCGYEWRTRPDGCDCLAPANGLDTYELEALLGWVHREMGRAVERERVAFGFDAGVMCSSFEQLEEDGREALAHHIAQQLGDTFAEDEHGEHGLAWQLCKAAAERFGGWPA